MKRSLKYFPYFLGALKVNLFRFDYEITFLSQNHRLFPLKIPLEIWEMDQCTVYVNKYVRIKVTLKTFKRHQ